MNDLTIEVKGTFQCEENDCFAFLKKLQMIEKASEQLELLGIALGKYYGCPIFKIEDKKYLLRDCSFKEDCAVLTLFMPEDLKYWESVNSFFGSEILK